MTDRKDDKISGIVAALIAVVAFFAGIVYGVNLPRGDLGPQEVVLNVEENKTDEDYKIQMACIDIHYAPENYEKSVVDYCESRLESDQEKRNKFKASVTQEMDVDSLRGLHIIQKKVEQ